MAKSEKADISGDCFWYLQEKIDQQKVQKHVLVRREDCVTISNSTDLITITKSIV
jgi:hypothetical protein